VRRHGRGPHQLLGRPDLQPALVKAPAEAGTVKDRTDVPAAEVGARARCSRMMLMMMLASQMVRISSHPAAATAGEREGAGAGFGPAL
jgi:hypothetical protein